MGRKKENKVYRHFAVSKENLMSKCLMCNNTFKTIHGANLMKHLKHKHMKEYEEIMQLNTEVRPNQNTLLSEEKSRRIRKECTNLVTVHGRPLAMLDDIAFQNILSEIPGLNITINSKNIRENIYDTAESLRTEIGNELSKKMISIKVDIASLSTRSFMGVNVQYIENGVIVIKNLATIELFERHTAENLKDQILLVLHRFHICLGNVYSFTTDNGANMLKMGRLFSKESQAPPQKELAEPGTAQQLSSVFFEQQVSQAVLFDNLLASTLKENMNSEKEVFCEGSDKDHTFDERSTHENNFIDSDTDSLYDADVEFEPHSSDREEHLTETVTSALLLGCHVDIESTGHRNIEIIRCAAHTLQLAVIKACDNTIVKETITSARVIVKRLLSQTLINKIRKSKKKLPILDCVTRWNSTVDMIERLIELKPICDEDLLTYLPDSVWDTLGDYLKSLSPAKKLIKCLQSEQITLGDFFMQWMICKIDLKNINTQLSLLLEKYMEEKEGALWNNDAFNSAVFLDPRLNAMLSEDQLMNAKKHLFDLHKHILHLNVKENVNDKHNDEKNPTEPEQPSAKFSKMARLQLDDLLSSKYLEKHEELEVLLVKNSNSTQSNIQDELRLFEKEPLLNSTNKILDYWETKKTKFPCLYQLAQVVLATPASQVSVERLFSSLKFIVSKYRYNLKTELIENILLIRNNVIYNSSK